jgi:drug/metabolite transporter (DMT)-like permease
MLAYTGLIFISLLWGIGFVAMKETMKSIPVFYLLTIRFTLSVLITGFIFRKRILNLTSHDIKAGLIIGIFLFSGFATQTIGIKYTTAGKLAFLTSAYVVIVPFLVWMMQKIFPGIRTFISSIICLAGMAFLTTHSNCAIGKGEVLGIICAFFFAGHIVAIEYYAKRKDPIVMTVIQMACVALLSGITAPFCEAFPVQIPASAILSLLYTVFFCTVFAFLIQNVVQRYTPSTHTSIILSLEAVFGAMAGIVILGEVFTLPMAIGGFLILTSIVISNTRGIKLENA